MSLRQNPSRRSGHGNGAPKFSRQDVPDETDNGIKAAQVLPALVDVPGIVSTVLGGCCANVWAYEQLLRINPQIGSALTFSQMLFITLQSLPSFICFPTSYGFPRLKPLQIPLSEWLVHVLLFSSGGLLNNWAYAYDVPLTVQIVFRSAGLPVSMLFGRLFLKKRYSSLQIISVAVVFLGAVLTTISRPSTHSLATRSDMKTAEEVRRYTIGITMLILSLLLIALLGIMQERAYKKYGPHWREGIFYTHLLSLPIFLFLISDIKQGFSSLSTTPLMSPHSSYLILGGNLVTQLVCVSGVNRLTAQVSSVSTNLVLTMRKALSLCFSVWFFGNGWNVQLCIGAGMVFFGSFLFSQTADSRIEKKRS